MNGYEDNSRTLQFEAVKEEPESVRPQQNRRADDEFSVARKGRGYEINDKKESGNGFLIGLVCVLTVLLIAAIVMTIFILKGDNEARQPQNDDAIVNPADTEKEEVPEVLNTIISCDLVFYPETIAENSDGSYSLMVDFLDSDGYVFETERIFINEDTEIRKNGERLAHEGFLYYMEETASGDKIVFKGDVAEMDMTAISLSFETAPEEEIEEIPEEVPEEIPQDEISEEELPEDITIGEEIE